MTSLLAFYQQHGISPVAQDVSDLPKHFARRSHLYRALGLPPFAITGCTVLEVGPGAGENALYTASLAPARYVLLEPNPTAADLLRTRWPLTRGGRDRWEILQQNVEDVDAGRFDVVLCEGLLGLSGGRSPELLEHLVRHVTPGGVLVITCIDAISDHAEVVRRAMAQRLIDRTTPIADQLAVLRPLFAPHLATLAGMTRSVDDWMLDNLLSPASIGPTFSLPDACAQLEGRFDVLGCSPRVLIDWRWYKQSAPGNTWAIASYWAQAHNLLDYRRIDPPRSQKENRALMASCERLRAQLRAYEAGTGPAPLSRFSDIGWFGRGQQYVSFVRRDA